MVGQTPFHFFRELLRLFGKPVDDFWHEYKETRNSTVLHEVLLGIIQRYGRLKDYLAHIAADGSLPYLIDAPDALGRSALAWAVDYGWAEAVTVLVEAGANVNQCTGLGLPLLHQALAGPASGRLDAEFMTISQTLLQAGVDVNSVDHEGWTLLHIAASWNSDRGVVTLITSARESLNWDVVTNNGHSAAQLARDSGGDSDLYPFLLAHSKDWTVWGRALPFLSQRTCGSCSGRPRMGALISPTLRLHRPRTRRQAGLKSPGRAV